MSEIRTRFAPSPTGFMHIGNLRTALYTYLISKSKALGGNGKFILRIEDTDRGRYVEGATEKIYSALTDVGLLWDEGPDVGGPYGPYIQSERMGMYMDYAKKLVELGAAYYCFCEKTEEEEAEAGTGYKKYDGRCSRLPKETVEKYLAEGKPFVIRQKMPKDGGATSFHDEIFGDVSVPNDELEDQILIKSDGMPTYNFANVIDDHTMNVTHVVRGIEYLSSTPKYNLLYKAFGWDCPVYIHVSPVMRDAQHKLSKRHGDPTFEDLINMGYLKKAVLNYVALLGWSPGGDREIYSLDELKEVFSISGISKSPAIFDIQKLSWLNGEYIKAMTPEEFLSEAKPYIDKVTGGKLEAAKIAPLLQTRIQTFCEIEEMIDFLKELPEFSNELYFNKKMKTDAESSLPILEKLLPLLENCDFTHDALQELQTNFAAENELKNGKVMFPLRIAISGKQMTPGGSTEIAEILGKDETIRRLKISIENLKK